MSGASTPCSSMFIEPIRSIVPSKSKPWNMLLWKCLRCAASCWTSGCVSPHVLAGGDEEASGAARRVADLVGSAAAPVISTISAMMWRGVRNWPFCPAEAILLSMYS